MQNPSDLQSMNTVSSITNASFRSKVFFFFGLALCVTAAGSFVGLNYLASYFISSPAIMWGLFAAELLIVFTAKFWQMRTPLNYFLFLGFAFLSGLTLVPLLMLAIQSTGNLDLIIKALGASAAVFVATAVFGHTTNLNLSGLRGFLMIGLIGMIVVSVIGIFIPWSNSFEMIFAGLGVLLFAGYTMHDMQKLKNYPENQYIDAALQLYLDMFNLFVYILRLIIAFNSRD